MQDEYESQYLFNHEPTNPIGKLTYEVTYEGFGMYSLPEWIGTASKTHPADVKRIVDELRRIWNNIK